MQETVFNYEEGCLKLINSHKRHTIFLILFFLIIWGIFLPLILIGWFDAEILGYTIITLPILSFIILDIARLEYGLYKYKMEKFNDIISGKKRDE